MIRALHRNLVWTLSGHTWAVFAVTGAAYTYAPLDKKLEALGARERLVKALPRQSLLMSTVGQANLQELVTAMAGDIDLARHPDWARTVEAGAGLIDAIGPQRRRDWIAVPLTARPGPKDLWRQLGAGAARATGIAPPQVSPAELATAQEKARGLLGVLGKVTLGEPGGQRRLRPATEVETAWIYERAVRRGCQDEPPLPTSDGARRFGRVGPDGLRSSGLAAVAAATLFDGGGPAARRRPPSQRRYLAVSRADGTTSYQAIIAVAEMPSHFSWPGCEMLGRLDEWFDFPIDWSVDLQTAPGEEAARVADRKRGQLGDQSQQVDDGGVAADGRVSIYEQARAELLGYGNAMRSARSAVEAQPVILLAVAGSSPQECAERADTVVEHFSNSEWTLVRPAGGQDKLWRAMVPDRPDPVGLGEFRQYLAARDFAMLMPFTSTDIGDPRGGLLGIPIGTGLPGVVLSDPSWGPTADASGSRGVVGELGSGKSYSGKHLMADTADQGGLNLCIDRTPLREWATFAQACAGTTAVIDVSANAGISFDPLRVIPGRAGAALAETFLTLLIDTPPMKEEGIAISEAVAAIAHDPDRSLARVITALQSQPGKVAADVARTLQVIARKDLATVVFDPGLDHLDPAAADNIVFCAASLELPTKQELSNDYLSSRLTFEKLFGRAVLYLIAAIIKERAFTSRRFAQVTLDECWYLASSYDGEQLQMELARDSRKHGAAAWFASQDPDSIPTIVAELLGTKMVMRCRKLGLAQAALRFIDRDPDDQDLLAMVQGFSPVTDDPEERAATAGECLLRDTRGQFSPIQILPFLQPALARAADTRPEYADDSVTATPAPPVKVPAAPRPARAPSLPPHPDRSATDPSGAEPGATEPSATPRPPRRPARERVKA